MPIGQYVKPVYKHYGEGAKAWTIFGPLGGADEWVSWGGGINVANWPPIKRSIDPDDFSTANDLSAFLEVHLMTSSASFDIKCRLWNETLGVEMVRVTTTSILKVRVRSSSFTFSPGENVYYIQFGGKIGATYHMYDGVLAEVVSE